MQDNAPGHTAAYTMKKLQLRGISTIKWPPFSPDLNPIETIWNKMKDYIMNNYTTGNMTYDRLREAVSEAWNSITNEDLNALIDEMHDRCHAVIDAGGLYTKY